MKFLSNFLALLAVVGALAANSSRAAAPAISDPNERLINNFTAPGTFPTGVTAANVNIQPQAGAEFDISGAGEDVLKVQFPASGPIKWTSSRYNSGDTALSIGPAQPANPLSYPENAFVDNFQAMNDGGPFESNTTDMTTLAWRVSNTTGALFASTRHNGVNDGYLSGGTPVGTIYGVAYFMVGGAQGWGFRMADGEYQNGGNGSSDLITGAAGSGGGLHEASSSAAVAYLSYEGGWQGAWVNATPVEGEATFASGAPDLLPSAVTWTGGTANITLPNVNSASDGMLFVAPSDGGSQTRIAAAFPNATGGWTANVRFDEDADVTGGVNSILTSGNGFQFLYVPYTATNLIGGHVNGATGATINSAGDAQFDVTRTAAGQYSLAVFEADGVTKKDENDGMLMLSVASSMPGEPTFADRTFLSYKYDNMETGNFIVQSRELTSLSGDDDVFGNEFALRDSNFYFTWVDFANPLSLPTTPGDFDGDGDVDDLDLADWKTSYGAGNGADADGDGDSDGADFLVWQQNVGPGAATPAAGAVPEPGSIGLILLAAAVLAAAKRIG